MEEANQHTNSTPNAAPQAATGTQTSATEEKEKQMLYGILSYIGILVVVSYILAKDMPGVKFHIKQGVVLFVIEIAAMIISSMVYIFTPLTMVVNIVCLIFSIIGIVNVVNRREKELPFIGQFAKHVPM